MPIKQSAPTVLTVKKKLRKNAGIACAGAVSGLTRKRTTRRDVEEKRAERIIPNRSVFIFPISYFRL